MRSSTKAFYISLAISQIFFLIVFLESRADTRLVKNISALGGSSPQDLTNVNGTLFLPPVTGNTAENYGKATARKPARFWLKTYGLSVLVVTRHI